jgi:hypothetical protein
MMKAAEKIKGVLAASPEPSQLISQTLWLRTCRWLHHQRRGHNDINNKSEMVDDIDCQEQVTALIVGAVLIISSHLHRQ